jgi:hypothetical protein
MAATFLSIFIFIPFLVQQGVAYSQISLWAATSN